MLAAASPRRSGRRLRGRRCNDDGGRQARLVDGTDEDRDRRSPGTRDRSREPFGRVVSKMQSDGPSGPGRRTRSTGCSDRLQTFPLRRQGRRMEAAWVRRHPGLPDPIRIPIWKMILGKSLGFRELTPLRFFLRPRRSLGSAPPRPWPGPARVYQAPDLSVRFGVPLQAVEVTNLLRRRLSQRQSIFRLGGSLPIVPSIGGGLAAYWEMSANDVI